MPPAPSRGNLPAVLAHLVARAAAGAGTPPTDGLRIGLVVEGGGMRSVVSAGTLAALSSLGLHHSFDLVYANSAGAINACYFLAGAIREASTLYEERLCDGRFIRASRLWRIMDLDYLFDHVLARHHPLDRDALARNRAELHIATTDVATGRGALWHHRDPRVALEAVLRASCAVPIYGGGPVRLLDRTYVDGFIANPLPVRSALAAGCTDLVVVHSYPFDGRPRRLSPARHYLEGLLLGRYPPALRAAYARRLEVYNDNALTAFAHREPGDVPRIYCLAAGPGDARPSQITTDPGLLRRARLDAYRRTLVAFGAEA